MSETPRTDKVSEQLIGFPFADGKHPLVDFARQLERDLAAARERAERAERMVESRDASFAALRVEDQPAYIQLKERLAQIDSAKVGLSAEEIIDIKNDICEKNGWMDAGIILFHKLCDQALAAIRMVPSEEVIRQAELAAIAPSKYCSERVSVLMARELLRIKEAAKEAGEKEGK